MKIKNWKLKMLRFSSALLLAVLVMGWIPGFASAQARPTITAQIDKGQKQSDGTYTIPASTSFKLTSSLQNFAGWCTGSGNKIYWGAGVVRGDVRDPRVNRNALIRIEGGEGNSLEVNRTSEPTNTQAASHAIVYYCYNRKLDNPFFDIKRVNPQPKFVTNDDNWLIVISGQPTGQIVTVDPNNVRAVYSSQFTRFEVRQKDDFEFNVKIKLDSNSKDALGNPYSELKKGDKTNDGRTIAGFYAQFSAEPNTKTTPLVEKLSTTQPLGFTIKFTKAQRDASSKNTVGSTYQLDTNAYAQTTDGQRFPLDRAVAATELRISLKIVADNADPASPGGGPGSGGDPTREDGGADFGGLLISAVNIILGAILALARWVIWFIGTLIIMPLLETTLSMTAADFASGPILKGWQFVRDIVNMFFILALIVIGIATILRIESYNYKKLLARLIVMALLVNFSLLIGRIIIEITDVAQFSFLPKEVQVQDSSGKLQGMSGVRYFYQSLSTVHIANIVDGFRLLTLDSQAALGATFAMVFQFLLELFVIITFGVLAVFMLIRTVGLWILLILSPVAYVFFVLPVTATYAKKWWTTFIKYALFAPIIAFNIRVALVLYKEGLELVPLGKTSFASGFYSSPDDLLTHFKNVANQPGGMTLSQSLEAAMIYVVILAFLVGAVITARAFGIFGANAIVGFAEKGMKAPLALGGKGAGALVGLAGRSYSRYLNKKMTAARAKGQKGRERLFRAAQFLNPRVAKEAWQARSKEKEAEAYLPAVGNVHDTLNRIMPPEWHKDEKGKWRLGQKTYFGRIGQRQLIHQKLKHWEEADLSEEEKVEAYNNATHPEDKEALDTVLMLGRHEDGRQILTALAKRNQRAEELVKQYRAQGDSLDVARTKADVQAQLEIPARYDAVDDLDTVTEKLRESGLTSEQIGEIQAHRDEIAESETKIRGLGNAVYEFDRNFRAANDMSGYEKLERERGSTAMLKELEGTGVFKVKAETLLDKDGKAVLDAQGNPIKVPVELDFKGQKVTDYASLQAAMELTKEGDKGKEENLYYELTGARKQMSAQKRIDRGDTEKWGAALEPAAFMVQDEVGNMVGFTAYGKRMFRNYSTLSVNAFRKTRRLQARAAKLAGLYRDETTGQINMDPNVARYDVMAEAFELNADLASAVVEKAELNEQEARKAANELKAYYVKLGQPVPQFDIEKVKEGHFTVVSAHSQRVGREQPAAGAESAQEPTQEKKVEGSTSPDFDFRNRKPA